MEYFDVYNRFGEKTGEIVERNLAHQKGICHQVVHLWIVNSKKQILLQKRSATKEAGANLWYVSAAGHIESGENIAQTLIRETKEELGLDISSVVENTEYLHTFQEIKYENDNEYIDNEFYTVFYLEADFKLEEMTLQKEEVQEVCYIDYQDFRQLIEKKDPSLWQHETGYKMLLISLDEKLIN